jgi:hypothetical protein
VFEGIDGGGLAVEFDEAISGNEVAVGGRTFFGQVFRDGSVIGFCIFPGAVEYGGARDPGQEQFQVIGGRDLVGVFLGDRFPLFGQAQVPGEGSVGEGLKKAVGGAGTPADGAPATVEEA